MQFVLIDETNGATTGDGSALTPAILASIAAAAQLALNRDYSPNCGGGDFAVRDGANSTDVQPGESVFAILPALPNAPGAIAYHDVNGNGVPVLYDAITLSYTLLGPGNSLAVAITHELFETAGDAGCNLWADDGQGAEWAKERCDAVEAQSYPVPLDDGTVVYVSNFVLDAFFTANASGPYDFMTLTGANANPPAGPFQTAPGGYQIKRSSGGEAQQVTGMVPVTVSVTATIPFESMRRPWRHGSRRERRGVTAQAA